jgi:esterase/lipase superfamily enzyme
MLPTLLRHPGYVSHLFSMSGAFNIKTFSTVFTTMMCFITVLSYLYGLDDPELWKMDIVLGTSNWDICFDNLKLSKVLSERNVHHWLDIRQDRSHDWPLWKEMFPHYLSRIKFFRLWDSIRKT